MIQFLRFDNSKEFDVEFEIIRKREAFRFFFKRSIYFVLFIYSTLFMAVAIPFFKTPCFYIYFAGSMATAFFVLRFINHIVKYYRFRGGSIKLNNNYIEVRYSSKTVKIPAEDITYLEINLLGNLLIREKFYVTSFPRVLLSEENRDVLTGLFQDMAPKRTAVFKKIWELADAVVVALVLAVHIIQYVIQAYYIPTGSMEETLQIGDHLFVEKITYGPIIPQMIGMKNPVHISSLAVRDLKRGDIIIFTPPIESEKHKDYIKRCIALPGDEFHIRDGFVYINGVRQDEPYTLGKPTDYGHFNVSNFNNIEGVVPAGKVVVLGDNRINSSDGRYFGYLDITAIKGRAFILYWNTAQIFSGNFSRLGLIK